MRFRLCLPLQVDTDIDGIKVFIPAGLLDVVVKFADILFRSHGKYADITLFRRLVQAAVHLAPTQCHDTMAARLVDGAVKGTQVSSLLLLR